MNDTRRQYIINTIVKREVLRPLSRGKRLLKDPLRALPFYFIAALSHIKPYKISFKTLWGTRMSSYLPEGNTFYYYGFCEANLTSFFLRVLERGNTFVDIGAHVGFYSLLASPLVEEEGSVHAFEPTPRTFEILKENISKLKNVKANNNALSDSQKDLAFADYGPGYGAYNTAHPKGAALLNKEKTMIPVTALRLDDYCKAQKIQPDFIKLDAEGFEYAILKGMESLLNSSDLKRPIISMEVAGDEAWEENRQNSFAYLKEKSYLPFQISDDGYLSSHTFKKDYTYDNLAFIPEERVAEYKAKGIIKI
jgi:FkbM family methyltransferase